MNRKATMAAAAVLSLAVTGVLAPDSASAGRKPRVRTVRAEDRCDPVTFNAFIPNICAPTPRGNVTLDEFFSELNPDDFGHEAWRFNKDDIELKKGETLVIVNTGGEDHTFTEVDEFGGGCVAELNGPLGLPPFQGDCGAAFGTINPPGGRVAVAPLSPGEHKFICILHPWMRATVEQEGSN
jgi:plastocyanin